MRDGVLKTIFKNIGLDAHINLLESGQAAHGRLMKIGFASGSKLIIRFDQGVSYWRITKTTPYNQRTFDFKQQKVTEQVRNLLKHEGNLEGGTFPTQLFVKLVD